MTAAIKKPGVVVKQETATIPTPPATPSLQGLIIGPCYQIVAALDDDNDVQSDAFAGSYQNGAGTIAYALPGLKTGALVDEDSIQVYLKAGNVSRLNPPKDEEIILSGTIDVYAESTGILTDADVNFSSEGIEDTDFVRITFRGETIDMAITAVGSTTLTLTDTIDEDLASYSYQIIREAAEFVFQSSAVDANHQFGDESDYLTLSAVGDYSGSAGDALNLTIDAGIVNEASSGFYSGTYLFIDTGFTSLSAGDWLLANTGGTCEALEIETVISDDALGLETTAASHSGVNWIAGEAVSTTSQIVSFTGGVATVTESYTGAVTVLIGTTAYPGDMATTTLTLDDNSVSGSQTITHIIKEDATGTGGDTGPGKGAAAALADGTTSNSVLLPSEEVAAAISAIDLTNKIVTASGLGNNKNIAYKLGTPNQSASLSFDNNGVDLVVALATHATTGAITTTFTELEDMLMDENDAGYVANISAIYAAAETGSTGAFNAYGTDDDTYGLDGGADANNLLLDEDLLGGASGVASVYVSYKALRVDVSDQANDASALKYSSITTMTEEIGPVSPDNPLCLGMYFAMLNAPGKVISGIGISATSSAQPEGTTAAYTSALEFAESEDVYSLTVLSQDSEVLNLVKSHVTDMNDPDNASERIAFLNKPFPKYSKATLIASGTSGGSNADFSADYEFNTNVDFSQNTEFIDAVNAGDTLVLVVSGLTTSSDSPTLAKGVDGDKYGVVVTNKDGTDPFVLICDSTDAGNASTDWDDMADKTWSLYSIGADTSSASDTWETVQGYGELYNYEQCVLVWPDKFVAPISGVDYVLEGFYACAGWVGVQAQADVGIPLSDYILTGFTGLKHSSNFYSKSQLDLIAGGGVWICYQKDENGPVLCRHQLTTNVSEGLLKRELSCVKALDYSSKILRNSLSGLVPRYNMTQNFIDSAGIIVSGTLKILISSGVIKSGKLKSVKVSDSAADQLDIVADVVLFKPGNRVELKVRAS